MPVAKALVAQNYDVFMFDFRGHGQSGDGRLAHRAQIPESMGESFRYRQRL